MDGLNSGMKNAINVHSQDPFEGMSHGMVSFPRLGQVFNQNLPFAEGHRQGGFFTTGTRNSSNIVVNGQLYNEITHRLANTDYDVAYTLYKIVESIESMCSGIFVLPETAEAINEVTSRLKQILYPFHDVTQDTVRLARGFVNEMSNTDAG